MKKLIVTSLLAILLSGCSLLTHITAEDKIENTTVFGTYLLVEEDFTIPKGTTNAGTLLPEGKYLPDSTFTGGGRINYMYPSILKVKFPWYLEFGATLECQGGLSVQRDNPYEDVRFFYYGCGEIVVIEKMSQEINYKIVTKNNTN